MMHMSGPIEYTGACHLYFEFVFSVIFRMCKTLVLEFRYM